jgi:hypothetical protein
MTWTASSTTVNGQSCALSNLCSVNLGAAQYSLASNGASGASLGGVSVGAGQILQGASSANPTATATPTLGVAGLTLGTLTSLYGTEILGACAPAYPDNG